MENVDFDFVENIAGNTEEVTIYRRCFQKYLNARYSLKLPETQWSKLVPKTEAVFFYLVEQGIKNGYNVNSILELPDSSGITCFACASQCSRKICYEIIERGIKVNSITTLMMVPTFKYPDLTIQMMEKGINPYVICYDGTNQIDSNSASFDNENAKRLLATFTRSVHFSIEDICCEESCPSDCSSNFKKFYYKNGPLVEMTDENRIGEGGFGMVFRQSFHGKPLAMKCIFFGEIHMDEMVKDQKKSVEEDISELRIQSATSGSGVLSPIAFVRQQNQEEDGNGKWIAENYNIYIYPLYDCNLYQLHENHYDQFTEQILNDILDQCLTRKGSNSKAMG